MINLKKTYIPFSFTSGVCFLSTFTENEILQKASDEKIAERIGLFQEQEISKLVFADINPRTRGLDFYISKLDTHGLDCYNLTIPSPPTKLSDLQEFVEYSEEIEKFCSLVGNSNFKYYSPAEDNKRSLQFLIACILYKDESIDMDELCSYLLPEGDSASRASVMSLIEWKNFVFGEKFLIYKMITKDFGLSLSAESTPTKNRIVTEDGLSLNLESLQKEDSAPSVNDKSSEEISFNLHGFQEKDFKSESGTEENPAVLVDELLDFAETFEVLEPETDWEDAFPDTGKKIDNNFTLSDNLVFEKGDSYFEKGKNEPIEVNQEEPFTKYMDDLMDTLRDLDAITPEEEIISANRENTDEEIPVVEENVPFPDVLNLKNLKTELDTDPSSPTSTEKENSSKDKKLETAFFKTSEIKDMNDTEMLEVDVDPTATYIDRQIKDALTKEVLEDQEDPRRKLEKKKKEPKPLTIIVTAEKTDSIHPLDKSHPDFKAIPLD